jgi:acetyl-CoA carboxylase biotin carboxyl carrier protein
VNREIRAELAGSVLEILVEDGDSVREGQEILLLESMKMEIPIQAPAGGNCLLRVAVGATVETGELLAIIQEVEP